MKKGDSIRVFGNAELVFGYSAYFENFWKAHFPGFRGCDISLLIPNSLIEKEDLFVFSNEYFPIGSKE